MTFCHLNSRLVCYSDSCCIRFRSLLSGEKMSLGHSKLWTIKSLYGTVFWHKFAYFYFIGLWSPYALFIVYSYFGTVKINFTWWDLMVTGHLVKSDFIQLVLIFLKWLPSHFPLGILVFVGNLPRIFPMSSLNYASFLIPYLNLFLYVHSHEKRY